MEDMFRELIGFDGAEYDPAEIEHEVHDSEELPIAGGIRAIHVPGHCAGQFAFLWVEHGGVLFAADTASNMMGLGYSLGYTVMSGRVISSFFCRAGNFVCLAQGARI